MPLNMGIWPIIAEKVATGNKIKAAKAEISILVVDETNKTWDKRKAQITTIHLEFKLKSPRSPTENESMAVAHKLSKN